MKIGEKIMKLEEKYLNNEGFRDSADFDLFSDNRKDIAKKLRDISGQIAKEDFDKKEKNKIMGKIRDAINLLNK